MPFEVFDKRMSAPNKEPTVTVQKRGSIALNRAAYKLMGEPIAVELLYDRERRAIGLRPADAGQSSAYMLRAQSPNNPASTVAVSSLAFTQHYGIETPVSVRYSPAWEDGILTIDLNGPGVTIRGNRSGRDAGASDD